ncbi:hypothetical protein ACIRON_15640 [Nocardioides sp. NPDC101246]|uniref:hypothetical protein n=1 Tax=Nocardioides sp. NPDC101246 TaxID=3364336 RepID=UPI0037F1D731
MTGKYALALEEARRGLDRQATDFANLRTRTTSLLGIGGTLVSVLGGLAIRSGGELRCTTYAAILSFVALALLSVWVLAPRKVTFTHDPKAIITAIDVPDAEEDDAVAHLAEQMGTQYDDNKKVLDRLAQLYTIAASVFVIEVFTLLLDLRGR